MASKEQLEAALEAARKAKNPCLVASILAAIEGRPHDPLSGLSVHPEVDHLWRGGEERVL